VVVAFNQHRVVDVRATRRFGRIEIRPVSVAGELSCASTKGSPNSEPEQTNSPHYVMGRTAEETLRLQMEAQLFDPSTRRLFEDAGLAPGMKVLELGSGAGDVALLAGDLVGPEGHVIGVDNTPDILNTARRRVQAAGAAHVTFINGAIDELELANDF
jgi:cyclopropane fatty-acyl-phospholipid synthase-like methyltransferase